MQDFSTIDRNFATNARFYREQAGLSQDDVAQRMTERGFGFTQATVWKIEQGKRAVRIGEAVALVEVLGVPAWLSLTLDPQAFSVEAEVQHYHRQAYVSYEAIKTAATAYLEAQTFLAFSVHHAREKGAEVRQLWTNWLDVPAERAALEARVEYEGRETIADQLDDAVEAVLTTLREKGYSPTLDIDDIVTTGPGRPHPDPIDSSTTDEPEAPAGTPTADR